MEKISYTELIKRYPHLKDKVSKRDWKRVFNETITAEFKIFYLEK